MSYQSIGDRKGSSLSADKLAKKYGKLGDFH